MFLESVSSEKQRTGPFLLRYLLGTIAVILALIIGYIPLLIAILWSAPTESSLRQFEKTMDFSLFGINSTLGLMLIIFSFIAGLLVLIVIVKYLHKRSFTSVITAHPAIRWERFLFAFSVWFCFSVLIEIVSYFMNPEVYSFSFEISRFLPLLIVSVLFLPLQTSFEELFLRGYMLQGFGLISIYRIIPVLITSVIFGLLHIANPEVEKFGLGVMMIFYVTFGLVLGIISIMDDGLELALGIHAANNIYASIIASYSGGALQTDALFKVSILNVDAMLNGWLIMAAVMLIIFSKKYNWVSWGKLFQKIQFTSSEMTGTDTTILH
jgi:hypothetical protein